MSGNTAANTLSPEVAGFRQRFDWRDDHNLVFDPPVSHQGACGSCVAFASLATLEMQLALDCNTSQPPVYLSRQFMISCGGGNCREGVLLTKAVDFLKRVGVPDYDCFPYESGETGKEVACNHACSDASKRIVRPAQIETVTDGFVDIKAIKSALLKGPVLSSLILYEDLEKYKTGVYRHKRGKKLGNHAITLIGWDDEDKAWIARNSWGERWGDHGYFKIAWDDEKALPGRYSWRFKFRAADAQKICSGQTKFH